MELRQLRYFVAVAEERHFNRAAEPRTPLLRRTTRQVDLTDAGRVLLNEARKVLAGADHAVSALRYAADGKAGLLRIAFVSSAAVRILPILVPALQAAWPRFHLELEESTTDRQLERILEGRLDLGILRDSAGVKLDVAQEAVQFPTILGLVASRTGIAIVPDSLRALHLSGLRYISLSDSDAFSTVSLICAADRRDTPLLANGFNTVANLTYLADN